MTLHFCARLRSVLATFGMLSSLGALGAVGACAGPSSDDAAADDAHLTSVSGSERSLTFQGMFYVPPGTSDATVAAQAALQAKGAFGALRTSNMVARSRYMTGIVPGSIKRLPINVRDTSKPGSKSTTYNRVTYMYKDTAIVPKTMTSSTFSTALLNPSYDSMQSAIRKNCTPGETAEGGEPIWYSLDTSGAACQADISAESDAIEADRVNLPLPAGFKYPWVTLREAQRVFFPTVFSLGSDTTNTAVSYPEYDKLYSGHGVEDGKLVVGIVAGYATHKAVASEAPVQGKFVDAAGNPTLDAWVFQNFVFATLVATDNRKFALTSPLDLAFTVNGHAYSFPSVFALANFYVYYPSTNVPVTEATADQQTADHAVLMQQIMDRLSKTWLTFEAPVTVTADGKSRPLTLKLQAYFGTDEEDTPVFKKAFKNNDVLAYMGHSYTGHGPYAPQLMSRSDFASTYQLMFFNGCVSFNYYNQKFFDLKAGGSKNLDLITNSIEGAFSAQEGYFAAAIFDGAMSSYAQILTKLQDPEKDFGSGTDMAYDPFRVVDGELDNTFNPATTPMTIQQ